MSKLSLYSDPKRLNQFIHRFWNAITLIEDRSEAISFLKDLLTPTEIRMLAKRLQIADMLAKGYKYEDIQNYVRATKQTVSTVNNKLNFGEDGLIKILQKLEKIDQQKQNKIEGKKGILSQPPGMGRMASDLLDVGLTQLAKKVRKNKKIKSVEEGLID